MQISFENLGSMHTLAVANYYQIDAQSIADLMLFKSIFCKFLVQHVQKYAKVKIIEHWNTILLRINN